MKSISFRIRRIYFDQIVAGTKKIELRKDNEYWDKRLFYNISLPLIAVFVCGKDVHRRIITGCRRMAKPEDILGRELSEQGKKDVGDKCIAVYLGDEFKEN